MEQIVAFLYTSCGVVGAPHAEAAEDQATWHGLRLGGVGHMN